MKRAKKSADDSVFCTDGGAFEVSLGSVLRGEAAPARAKEPPVAAPPVAGELDFSKLPRVSLQRQTAGRGGKTVTLVILPRGVCANLDALAREMRKGLGCGSRVEDGRVVLQGDICDRAAEWLEKKGVRKISQ